MHILAVGVAEGFGLCALIIRAFFLQKKYCWGFTKRVYFGTNVFEVYLAFHLVSFMLVMNSEMDQLQLDSAS